LFIFSSFIVILKAKIGFNVWAADFQNFSTKLDNILQQSVFICTQSKSSICQLNNSFISYKLLSATTTCTGRFSDLARLIDLYEKIGPGIRRSLTTSPTLSQEGIDGESWKISKRQWKG